MSKPILFYSRKSQSCIELWKFLQTKGRLEEFIKICVDNNNKIPDMIKSVPSILIKGRPVIEGHGIKMFLDSPAASSQNRSSIPERPDFKKSASNNNNLDKPPQIESSTNNLNGILDFNAIEMGGAYSDKYSFIQDNPSPMDNQYQFIEKMTNNQITGNVSQNNTSDKKGQLNNRLEQLQRERNNM